jgi:hypothetical protein
MNEDGATPPSCLSVCKNDPAVRDNKKNYGGILTDPYLPIAPVSASKIELPQDFEVVCNRSLWLFCRRSKKFHPERS